MVYTFVFSPCGSTKKVADVLAEEFSSVKQEVDLTDPKKNFASVSLQARDLAIVVVPSYGGRVPAVAIDRIQKIQGNKAKAIAVVVYGNRAYEDTLMELKDTLKEGGFQILAAVSAIARHSIVHTIAADRPDMNDAETLKRFAQQILQKYTEGQMLEVKVPGNHPYKKAEGTPMIPKPTKDCNQCGECAKLCPVQAIDPHNVKKVDKQRCISCMRCVEICPKHARKINELLYFAAEKMLSKSCAERKENELFI